MISYVQLTPGCVSIAVICNHQYTCFAGFSVVPYIKLISGLYIPLLDLSHSYIWHKELLK